MANSTIETDVAIIGGGGAGIPAAIEVARAGGQALVLEGAAECGGTAAGDVTVLQEGRSVPGGWSGQRGLLSGARRQ